jgi:hypothetical protein
MANCLVLTKVDAGLAPSAEQSTAQGPSCAAHLHPSGVAAGHEPLTSEGFGDARCGVVTLTGTRPWQGADAYQEVWSPLSYCPRSSLPTAVLARLAGRLAPLVPLRSPGQSGTPPLPLEVRLDAVAAVILDGLSYRRAARMVGISKTEVGDSMNLLLPKLAG